jgi:hypothetical protein
MLGLSGLSPDIMEHIFTDETKGRKYDKGKLQYNLFPMELLREAVKVYTYGAEKYEANNWQGVEPERYYAAMHRHLIAHFVDGEKFDPESGLLHLAHAYWNLGTLLVFELTKEKADALRGSSRHDWGTGRGNGTPEKG